MPSDSQLYSTIASLLVARENCARSGNTEWQARHAARITELCADYLPSGSGIDAGTTLDDDRSTPEKLIFQTSFHHMNDVGMYDGWTAHSIIVRPSLVYGLTIRVTGPNRNEIKDYLHDVFHEALTTVVPGV